MARWPNLRYGVNPGRVGQWIAALEQGRGAARTVLSGDEYGGAPVTLLPRFWSDQFGLRIQAAGVHPEADVCVTEMRPGRTDVARAGASARSPEPVTSPGRQQGLANKDDDRPRPNGCDRPPCWAGARLS